MAPIFFKSPEHRQRFLAAMQAIGKIYDGKLDQEYAAALYILSSSAGTWQQAQSYVDRDGIDFEALLREVDFSSGYSVLIQWAGNLFNGQVHIDPVELMRLDDSNFQVALAALQLRRMALPVEDFKEMQGETYLCVHCGLRHPLGQLCPLRTML